MHAVITITAAATTDSFAIPVNPLNPLLPRRYDLRVPPSAYVGALRTTTTRRYPPVALDLANVPLSAELDALGRGAGTGTGAGARLGLGFLGGRAATRGVKRAVNVDEGGRRLDSGRGFDGEEVEGEEGGREKLEELPAYDKYGGPPGYHEHVGGGGGMPVIMTVVSDDVGVGDYEAWIRQQQQQQDREEETVQRRTVQDGGGSDGGGGGREEQDQEGMVMFTGVGPGGGLGGNWRRRVDGSSGEGSGEGAEVLEDREGNDGAIAEAEAENRGGAAEDRTGQGTTGAREEGGAGE
ncbi:hypothetical protein K435DRAFT_844863 [Dendrothele bispora CBS 962.96]|uniref:Uncharacterized protein n=1 Tax=Dendrothele bispora (strain CBS 962.96) TaxID=1314807 RepID=A0A4S8KYG3_DENBC|nr:hypothetical protein K435DRAFT_844863 [Dendrothele bispora CBS 962.96]